MAGPVSMVRPSSGKRCTRIWSAMRTTSASQAVPRRAAATLAASGSKRDGSASDDAGSAGGSRNIAMLPNSWRRRNWISARLRTANREALSQNGDARQEQRAMMRRDANEYRDQHVDSRANAARQDQFQKVPAGEYGALEQP